MIDFYIICSSPVITGVSLLLSDICSKSKNFCPMKCLENGSKDLTL